jgi:6-pyruvoyltetrahydropterin/6-carboxytetrahydropterin synthase
MEETAVAAKARVAVTVSFEAAHVSRIFPEGHPNRRLHGHSYEAEFVAEGAVGAGGMVVSAERLAAMANSIKSLVDHRYLNDVEGLDEPTMERLADFLLRAARTCIQEVVRVRISRPTLQQWAEAWAE